MGGRVGGGRTTTSARELVGCQGLRRGWKAMSPPGSTQACRTPIPIRRRAGGWSGKSGGSWMRTSAVAEAEGMGMSKRVSSCWSGWVGEWVAHRYSSIHTSNELPSALPSFTHPPTHPPIHPSTHRVDRPGHGHSLPEGVDLLLFECGEVAFGFVAVATEGKHAIRPCICEEWGGEGMGGWVDGPMGWVGLGWEEEERLLRSWSWCWGWRRKEERGLVCMAKRGDARPPTHPPPPPPPPPPHAPTPPNQHTQTSSRNKNGQRRR